MKIRNGFVSNSSSSSFLVEYKNTDKSFKINNIKFTLEDFIDLLDKGNNWCSDNTHLKYNIVANYSGEERYELTQKIKEWNDYASDEDIKFNNRLIKEINKMDKSFLYFQISYHDNIIVKMYDLFKKKKMFKEKYVFEN